jgi:UDPglucose 6-dehydrogenase
MKISVIGAGYVGLTTAACMAEIGHTVRCADNDPTKLATLRAGKVPFFEPHLEGLVTRNTQAGRLCFETTENAVIDAEVIFICVGTPPLDNGDADLAAVANVARTIAQYSSGDCLVIEKSTVPVQTGQQLKRQLQLYARKGLHCKIASNPEFLREGSAINDFFHPDRIVVGVEDERVAAQLAEVYHPVLEQTFRCPVHPNCQSSKKPAWIVTDTNSAELIKHASNSFLAMKISFINMVADLCEAVGADVTKVALGMGLDARIGSAFLNPGVGFGGFCFPKDVQAFVRIAEKAGCDFSLMKEVENINKRRVRYFIEKIRKELWVLRDRKIAIWGLAFKPNTDDVRFAPAIEIVKALSREGSVISAYDPEATEKTRVILPDVNYCTTPYDAAQDAEAILIVTEWDEFHALDWTRLRGIVSRPLIVDGRNMLKAETVTAHGFHYLSVGRQPAFSADAAEETPAARVQELRASVK